MVDNISLKESDRFNSGLYPKTGLYYVSTEIGTSYVYVNLIDNIVTFLGDDPETKRFFGSGGLIPDEVFKLQVLKLTGTIEDPQYKQLLAMLASSDVDRLMARDSIKTIYNTST